MLDDVPHKFLHDFLEYVEDTESPRIFYAWAALTGVGACLGRRCFLPFGPAQIFANHYVLLVGPPGVKKSTAISVVEKLLRKGTAVRFAPDDMGGQRQGLIRAMEGQQELNEEELMVNGMLDSAMMATLSSPEDVLRATQNIQLKVDKRDAHCMFACAKELTTFTGHNSIGLMPFLIKAWDGDDYDYQLKTSQMTLREPLLSILGATTPTAIIKALPPEAIGEGVTSRIIFVHGSKKHKSVPWPKSFNEEIAKSLQHVYNELFYKFDGTFKISDAAKKRVEELYDYDPNMQDTRFVYYEQRRQAHLLKCAMTLAACDLRISIELSDIEAAHALLSITEKTMPEALGEFGLSPLATAKQKMLEFIQNARGPVSTAILYAVMNKDMRKIDFINALSDLCNGNKIVEVDMPGIGQSYIYKDDNFELQQQLDAFLGEEVGHA